MINVIGNIYPLNMHERDTYCLSLSVNIIQFAFGDDIYTDGPITF